MSAIDDVVNKVMEDAKSSPPEKPEPILLDPLCRVWKIKDVKLPGQYSFHTLVSPGGAAKALMIKFVCPECSAIMVISNGVVGQPAIIECVGKNIVSGEKCPARFVVDGKGGMGRIIEDGEPDPPSAERSPERTLFGVPPASFRYWLLFVVVPAVLAVIAFVVLINKR